MKADDNRVHSRIRQKRKKKSIRIKKKSSSKGILMTSEPRTVYRHTEIWGWSRGEKTEDIVDKQGEKAQQERM